MSCLYYPGVDKRQGKCILWFFKRVRRLLLDLMHLISENYDPLDKKRIYFFAIKIGQKEKGQRYFDIASGSSERQKPQLATRKVWCLR